MIGGEKLELWWVTKLKTGDKLVDLLTSNSSQVRAAARDRLSKLGSEVKDTLINRLQTAENKQQQKILMGLISEYGGETAKKVLFPYLFSPQFKFAAVKNLLALPSAPVRELIFFASEQQLEVSKLADCFFGLERRKKEELLTVLEGGKSSEQRLVLRLLGELEFEGQEVISKVKEVIFNSRQMWVRYQALKTLVKLHPKPSQLKDLLMSLSEDRHELVRLEAEELIKNMD
jgi:hypothetical protein